jgi:hypothetical protein
MVSRSEKARQEVYSRHGTESRIRRETGETGEPDKRWIDVECSRPIRQTQHKHEWSPEADDILRELVDDGAPIDVICSKLKCSCDAVRTRVLILRLSVRSPE